MKALLIAEKPDLRRKIEDVYKKHRSDISYDITFANQRGHLVTLLLPDELSEDLKKWQWETLPFHPEDYGGWKYKVTQEKKTGRGTTTQDLYAHIKKELASGVYDCVINAGDPDQEGELLIRSVLATLKCTLPIKRFWTNDLTEKAIVDALQNLRDDDHEDALVNLLAAAYGRQHSDYRFGMNISRAASLKLDARVACGRVKTPILGMVCKRDKEIANFKPSTCYGVKSLYVEKFTGQMFDEAASAAEKEKDVEKSKEAEDENVGLVWFDTEKEAKEVIASLGKKGKIVSFESKKQETYAPKLFKLATVQIAAGKLGYDSEQTLNIIQGLYEKAYLSYPRTDCEYISSSEDLIAMIKSAMSVPELVPFIKTISKTAIGKVRATKKWVNDAALKEAGHSALVPTTLAPKFETLSADEQKIYTLICRQFIAIFLPPLVQNKVSVVIDVDGRKFKSNGKTLVSAGYTEIFGTKFTDNAIPAHKVGDDIEVDAFEVCSKTTTCPKKFTDADLIAACENPQKFLFDASLKSLGKRLKIGTSATRAAIIKQLIVEDKYLQYSKEGRTTYITPTEIGMKIYDNIHDLDICKVDLTGEWEILLEDVRTGKMALPDFENKMKSDVNAMVDNIKGATMSSIGHKRAEVAVVTPCPKCGGNIMSGPKGFYCSNYKSGCGMGVYKQICDSMITDAEFAKLLTGAIVKKKIKKGISVWEQELKYDSEAHKIEFVAAEEKESSFACPRCGGAIIDDGRTMKCSAGDFTLWKSTCGVVLSAKHIENFFTTGSTGTVKGMKGKSGKSFDAAIILKADKSGTEFKFT